MPEIRLNFTAAANMTTTMSDKVQSIETDVEDFVRATLQALNVWTDDGGAALERTAATFTDNLRQETTNLYGQAKAIESMNETMQGTVGQAQNLILGS